MSLPPRDKTPLPRLDERRADAVFDTRHLTEEECRWWEAFAQDVTPLDVKERVQAQPVRRVQVRHKPDASALDLHGMTRQEAFLRLTERLEHAVAQGERDLLVITGRGKDGQGVLKRALPRWLEAMECWVHHWEAAPHEKGGEGAMIVRIRKKS